MSDPKIKIVEASYHRNGICGDAFYAILFDNKENGRMIASLFEDRHCCAVYSVPQLAAGNITFGAGNSWRGDDYDLALRPALKDYLKREPFE